MRGYPRRDRGRRGALGFVLPKDPAPWMRPLSRLVFAACAGTIAWSLLAGSISPENHAIRLATGIFVSIVNILVSLLNLFSRR